MSGGGGGIIIIRSSIVRALEDPLVSGHLPQRLHAKANRLCGKDVDEWDGSDDEAALFLFNYAATHC
jgi:hypothetical protein